MLGRFSVIGRYDVLKGERSSAAMGSAGLGIGFLTARLLKRRPAC